MSVRRNTVAHQQERSGADVQIEVRDLGPIANGKVDLRPLTVFVGPSNTGKTYMSILIYALHQVLGGFRLFPPIPSRIYRYLYYRAQGDRSRFYEPFLSKDDRSQLLSKLVDIETPFMYHDLPVRLRKELNKMREFGAELELELNRCFDSVRLSELIRTSSSENNIKISLNTPSSGNIFWQINMNLSDEQSTVSGDFNDFVLIPEIDRYSRSREDRGSLIPFVRDGSIFSVIGKMADIMSPTGKRVRPSDIHYLPAARSGIMQSHRVIASSLVGRSTRAGLERFPALPAFSGVMADFMQQLIMYPSERRNRVSRPTRQILNQIATELEAGTLGGLVGQEPSPGGYPEFIYRPDGTTKDVSMTRASSMVSELAPVVLFLRGVLGIGDTLIIEEPESHLHPEAQTQVAKTLARLVRAGVRVLITTHSDWLLKQIGILIREGELEEQTGKPPSESALPSALHPSEVGVWLFRQDGTEQGSTIQEIPFDRSEGVEPEEYYDVAEELYNRSADLQNRLEESRDP